LLDEPCKKTIELLRRMEGTSAPIHVAMPKASTKTLDVTKD
jgi:hypothetical protein